MSESQQECSPSSCLSESCEWLAFADIVVATLDPDYFRVVLQSVLYAPGKE